MTPWEYIFSPRRRKPRRPARPKGLVVVDYTPPAPKLCDFLESLHAERIACLVWCDEGTGAIVRVRLHDAASGCRVKLGIGRPSLTRARKRGWVSPRTDPIFTSKHDRLAGVSMCEFGVTDDGHAAVVRARARGVA